MCFIRATNRYYIQPKPVKFNIPPGWPAPVYDLSKNPLTEEGIALGLKLFYDERLSIDGNFSCGSCHQQFAAFATFSHPLSHGVNNAFTTRNAPGLFNLAWKPAFMHDGGIAHLDAQPLAPLTATNEMGETIAGAIRKLKADPEYRRMFKAAFGDEKITTKRMTKALSQFMLTLISNNSKYDKVIRGEVKFTAMEQKGYELFKSKQCVSCHAEPFFTDFSYRDIGLQPDSVLKDYGRFRILGNVSDSMKFMVPSLRNVWVTFPYGHDGRFYSINDAIEHYSSKVVAGPNTDPIVRNKIALKKNELYEIRSFLFTLTDSSFLKDPRFVIAGYQPKAIPGYNH
jgi:cytochrome c peroxidase